MGSDLISGFFLVFYLIVGLLSLLELAEGHSLINDQRRNATTILPENKQSNKGCNLPEYPKFGKWSILGGLKKNPKEGVSTYAVLTFECDDGYLLSTSPYVACLEDDEWSGPMPTCTRKCPPIYTTKTTKIKCHNSEGKEVNCDEATNGTYAIVTCAPYYEPIDQRIVTRFCWEGNWNLPPTRCQPVCGQKKTSSVPLIANAKMVEQGNYPWVTALYQKHLSASGTLEFMKICEGSVLTERVILTAAHCVTDEEGNNLDKKNMMIGVGKYHNKYNHTSDTKAQYTKVENIFVPRFYKGDNHRYASDIALLITEDELLLSQVVQPVCYQDILNIHLNSTSVGVISGWVNTMAPGSPSDVLLEMDVFYKDEEQCSSELPKDWADKYYTPDKMCAGYYNKSIAVFQGGSGRGLIFQNRRDNRYYVHGVLSMGRHINDSRDIDREYFTLYTKVAAHYDWLEKIISKYGTTT